MGFLYLSTSSLFIMAPFTSFLFDRIFVVGMYYLGSWYLCVRMYTHGGEGNHIFLFRMTLGTLTHVVILEGNENMDPVRYSVVTVSVIEKE